MKPPSIDPAGTVSAFQQLGQVIANSAPSMADMHTVAVKLAERQYRHRWRYWRLAGREDFRKRIDKLIASMKAATDELREYRMTTQAEPAEVVQYILQQPGHTWNGVTIYPDEAWRYEQKSDWMWWRR